MAVKQGNACERKLAVEIEPSSWHGLRQLFRACKVVLTQLRNQTSVSPWGRDSDPEAALPCDHRTSPVGRLTRVAVHTRVLKEFPLPRVQKSTTELGQTRCWIFTLEPTYDSRWVGVATVLSGIDYARCWDMASSVLTNSWVYYSSSL